MTKRIPRHASKTVWVASAWFSNCDPFMTVIIDGRKTEEQAEEIYHQVVDEAVEDMYASGDWGIAYDEFVDDVCWPGRLFKEKLSDVLDTDHDVRTVLHDLKTQGYAVI